MGEKKSLRVLIITSTFPRSEKEVLAKWIGEFVLRLQKKGLEIDVFAPSHNGLHSHTYFGIRVNRFRYAPRALEFLTQDEGAIAKIRKQPFIAALSILYIIFGSVAIFLHVRRNKYDVIHVHWPFPNGIFGIIGKMVIHSRLIFTFYGAEFTLIKLVPFGTNVFKKIVYAADAVVAISSDTKKRLEEIISIPVAVIPFGVSTQLKRVSQKATQKGSKKKILFVGRLIERKGLKYLNSAMVRVINKLDAQLDIVGTGPLEKEIKDQIEKAGLGKHVHMLGQISDIELQKMYQVCDVFVLPAIVDRASETEGLGVVLLEAMSFKKPVVATQVGGISDIVEHNKNGLLVPEKNSDALADAIIKILKDTKLAEKLGNYGYSHTLAGFSWETIIGKTLQLYKKVN